MNCKRPWRRIFGFGGCLIAAALGYASVASATSPGAWTIQQTERHAVRVTILTDRRRASLVARISSRRTDARHRAPGPAALRRGGRSAGSDSDRGSSRIGDGIRTGRAARRGAAPGLRPQPPRLYRLRRPERPPLRHRARPRPARRPPARRRGGAVPGVAQVRAAAATSAGAWCSTARGTYSSPSGTAATGRARRTSASHAGSVIRLAEDGGVPPDNPFVSMAGARPEIFSLGNRNVQGAAMNPWTGELWAHEHGPQGGDEVNVIRSGTNYGWPIITYGKNYGIGTSIGEGTHRDDVAPPLHQWTPSIAPSGMAFYDRRQVPPAGVGACWSGHSSSGFLSRPRARRRTRRARGADAGGRPRPRPGRAGRTGRTRLPPERSSERRDRAYFARGQFDAGCPPVLMCP